MKLRVVLEPSDEGGFTALVPSLPGCISEGDTRDEALANIQEAIQLYLEPVEDDTTLSPIDAEVINIRLPYAKMALVAGRHREAPPLETNARKFFARAPLTPGGA